MLFPDTYPMTPAARGCLAGTDALDRPTEGGLAEDIPAASSGQKAATTGTLQPARRAERRFALHEVADDRGQVQARDLLFRLDGLHMVRPGQPLDRVSTALANALMDGFAVGSLPAGRLFIAMDEADLRSPVAEVVTDRVGAILLSPDIRINTPVLLRVAQLRAAGVRFGIDGMLDEHDPRWLLAPYADTLRLDLGAIAPDELGALVARADAEGLEVIGCGVRSMVGYQRLAGLAVTQMQGPFIAGPQELTVPALPGCDEAVLLRTRRLLDNRVSLDAVAAAAAADPALVMRLQLLHRLYRRAAGRSHGPEQALSSLAHLLQALPPGLLGAWLEILRRTACHDHQLDWAASVRAQVDTYRQALNRRHGGADADEAQSVESAVWLFLKRLSSPAHYFKTLRFPA